MSGAESPIPPRLDSMAGPPRPRWRWAAHLILLAGYVLGVGLVGSQMRQASDGEAALPPDLAGLAKVCAMEFGVFALVFALAWHFSRATLAELFLRWRGGWRPLMWGAVYSVALRIGLMMVLMAVLIPFSAIKGPEAAQGMRPKIEAIVAPEALKDPAYLVFVLTVVSFVVAGLREELWRAGIFAGLIGIAPGWFGTRKGQYLAVLVAAVIFGVGHLPQGWGGVFLTGTLGVGLGLVIVRHKSIWEAVIAHGFFDATTFVMLYVVVKHFPEVLRGFGVSG